MKGDYRIRLDNLTDDGQKYALHSTGDIQHAEGNEDIDGNVVHGEIYGQTDEIAASGVPIGFEAERPWDLDVDLDMGDGYEDWRPTWLNAGTIELRASDGNATYWFRMSEPGMVIRGDDVEANDVIVTQENTFGTGHSIGGIDSFRFWPPFGIEVTADNPAEWRIPDADPDRSPHLAEWTDVTVYVPEMKVG